MLPEKHPFYERLFMRVSFAWMVFASTPITLTVNSLPAPNGIARLIDLRFLTDADWLTACRLALLVALGLYIVRILLWLALPVALFVNVAVNAVENSQGAIHHVAQIVSLVLLVQTAAHYYDLLLGGPGARADAELEERQISWSQQAIAATYFVAGLTKVIATHATWMYRARFLGVQLFKTAYQVYYDHLDPAGLHRHVAIAQFAAAHGTLIALIAGTGLVLELLAPLMLLGRVWGLVLGCGFVAFHSSIEALMQLDFMFYALSVLIFIVSPIYWVVRVVQRIGRATSDDR